MFILTTLLHIAAFGLATVDPQYLGARMMLFFVGIPVLPLHIAVWAAARFLTLSWTLVTAILLNTIWAAAGLAWWAFNSRIEQIALEKAVSSALIFIATGLAASALLIAWVRAMTRRRQAAKR